MMLDSARKILGDLIAFPTVSVDSNLALIDYVAAYLAEYGARVEVIKDDTGAKANLFATLGPDQAKGGIILSGHTDVVPITDQDWSSDPFVMEERDGRLYGRGTCDMKGFIACALAMVPAFAKANLQAPLHFAFTYDEETGCLGGQALVEDLRARGVTPDIAIIGEPTMMQIVEAHKGCFEYTTTFHGCEGHGSKPDAGVNAAEYAARYVGRLMELREALKARVPDASPFDPPHTTINIGRIAGGVAHNVIAGLAEVDWEMRPVQVSDADFVKSEIAAYVNEVLLPAMHAVDPRAGIDTYTIAEVVGLEPMTENAARQLVAELTGQNSALTVPFGTEAGLFQSLGMSAVVCGPGSIEQAHKPDEYIELSQMQQCLDMLAKLAPRLERKL